jgi:N-methylhydantoinase A
MRYAGQGWEIPVALPDRAFAAADKDMIKEAFRARYAQFFGRAVDGPEIEIVTWSVKVQDIQPAPDKVTLTKDGMMIGATLSRAVFDPATGAELPTALFERESLKNGVRIIGPAVIVEHETSTVVTSSFDAVTQPDGTILLIRKGR